MNGGQPCEVDENIGACRLGITDCDAQGQVICTPFILPGSQAEQCDGLDNDCDDEIDEEAPCPDNQVCSRGRCVTNGHGYPPNVAGDLARGAVRLNPPRQRDKLRVL